MKTWNAPAHLWVPQLLNRSSGRAHIQPAGNASSLEPSPLIPGNLQLSSVFNTTLLMEILKASQHHWNAQTVSTCLSRGNICSLLGTGYFNTRKNIKIAGQKQQSHLHRAGLTWFGLQSQPAKHRQPDKGSFFKGYIISSELLAHCWK